MKITINTNTKPHTVEIEGSCTIGELTDFLSKYYGDFTWRDIQISGKSMGINIPWVQPTTQPFTSPAWPNQGGTTTPWRIGDFPGSTITYCSDTNSFTTATGTTIQVNSLGDNIIAT